MDRGDDKHLVFLCNIPHELHHLVAGRRIQTAGRLVKKEYLRAGDELAGHADASLLSTGYSLADGCSNESIGLVLETKRR